ncbi:Cytochrome c-type biogenesis protein CcmC, putative heme lyase for CcmE [invertebrate metagenome]|uniref:Cytochrome c-type biogenesis protein CcmC, putative heme lyase for CcmE n=1 Tax=invertebrate metagenome TaxID=1711999 RepID=A0A484H5A2_9ZZZZ
MHCFADPVCFLRIANAILLWSSALTVILLGSGLVWGLVVSPADYQQGEIVRIMYIHAPAAWMGLFAYTVTAVASAVSLLGKHPLADLVAKASSPVGTVFTFICLVTGALWGKPMWGAYWVWDARLTSMLVLLFLYLGHIALVNAFDDYGRGARAGAVLAVIGFINIPVIKFSVDWWNTLHQPASITRTSLPTIAIEMLIPLIIMLLAFKAYYVTFLLVRMRSEIAAAQVRAIRLAQMHGR